jgi:hypothetical protein
MNVEISPYVANVYAVVNICLSEATSQHNKVQTDKN